jgi:hypothetical protein
MNWLAVNCQSYFNFDFDFDFVLEWSYVMEAVKKKIRFNSTTVKRRFLYNIRSV